MQCGNFRFTIPQTGLDVVLGQLLLDLHLLQCAILTHLRTRSIVKKGWKGKGPGKNGKAGHILRMEEAIKEIGLPCHTLDTIPKEMIWEQNYNIDKDLLRNNVEDCNRL